MLLKKTVLLFWAFILINCAVDAQTSFLRDVIVFSQGFPLNGLTGNGYNSTVIGNVNNISNSNPALINNFSKPAFGLSYLFSTNIDEAYIAKIGYKKTKNEIPNSAGFVMPVTKSFNLALGMNQSYNKDYDLYVTATTVNNPDGDPSIPKVHIFEKTLIYGFDLSAAYSIENLFTVNDILSIGSDISFNYLYTDAYDFQYSTQSSAPEIGWKIGAVYKNQYEDNKSYSLGVYYENSIEFTDFIEGHPLGPNRDGLNRDSLIYVISPIYYNLKSKLPDKLSIGFSITPITDFNFHGEVKEIFLSDANSNLKNQLELAVNASYLLSNNFKVTGGVFYTGRSHKEDFSNANDNSEGIFLLCGLIAKLDFANFEVSVADGHLFSGDWRKQTVMRMGIDVIF